MVRRTFTDVGEQYGKVVAYIPPDDTSEDMELGERWVVEYQTNGKQELLMSSEVLVSIDAEVSADMRAADEEEEEKEEGELQESKIAEVDPVEVPPRALPDVPQAHPLIGKRIGNLEDNDIGVVVMWYWGKAGAKKTQRFLVKWNSPLQYKGKLTLWKDYSKDGIEANLV
jgi:hypothetical protein